MSEDKLSERLRQVDLVHFVLDGTTAYIEVKHHNSVKNSDLNLAVQMTRQQLHDIRNQFNVAIER